MSAIDDLKVVRAALVLQRRLQVNAMAERIRNAVEPARGRISDTPQMHHLSETQNAIDLLDRVLTDELTLEPPTP